MKYPTGWVTIKSPGGNYYKVFQDPNLTDNYRLRINVAAHTPVKDKLKVFLDEFRRTVKNLQKKGDKSNRTGIFSARIKQGTED